MAKKTPRQTFEITRADLARLIGCPADRITKHVTDGLPVLKTGAGRGKPTTFDLRRVLSWLVGRRTSALDDERTRYSRLLADRVQQEVRSRAGELVEASEVERRWSGMVAASRERLLAIPAVALQRGLIAEAAEDELIALVADALTDLSERGARA